MQYALGIVYGLYISKGLAYIITLYTITSLDSTVKIEGGLVQELERVSTVKLEGGLLQEEQVS